ncbi:MAG: inositol monophosphatase family protein [Hormoscilla sp. GUM202]|nr:inositol monophosphatase family protein [Hormoscilla sp. GUM202]
MNSFWKKILYFAQKTTVRVGNHLLRDFGRVTASEKADGSLVTQADKWAEGELTEAIASAFPSHGVLSEETAQIFPDNEWCWIIDPIDGTTNFTRGIPIWGISLGLLYQGTPVFGYVHLPPNGQTFHGFWGKHPEIYLPKNQAFLNQRPIRTSENNPSSNHFFNLCARSTDVLRRSPEFPCKIRMLGVATYNLLTVAAGIAIGGVEATPKIWDIAAVWAILQAAGGEWCDSFRRKSAMVKVGSGSISRITLVLMGV